MGFPPPPSYSGVQGVRWMAKQQYRKRNATKQQRLRACSSESGSVLRGSVMAATACHAYAAGASSLPGGMHASIPARMAPASSDVTQCRVRSSCRNAATCTHVTHAWASVSFTCPGIVAQRPKLICSRKETIQRNHGMTPTQMETCVSTSGHHSNAYMY